MADIRKTNYFISVLLGPLYRGLSFFMLCTIMVDQKVSKHLKDIEFAAKFFNSHFIGKEMIYTSKNKSISIKFQPYHFAHLCGIKYRDGAKQFFKAILNNRLVLSKINVKEDGTTYLKLPLLKSVDFLITKDVQITDGAFYLDLQFENSVRTSKLIFALTLSLDENQELYPQSLLDLKKMNDFPNGEKVISIKSIDLSTNEEIIYL